MDALALGRSWEGEFGVRDRDGRLVRVLVYDAPAYDDDGQPIGVVGYSIPANASSWPPALLARSAQGGWTRALRAGMFDSSARVGVRTRLRLIALGVGLETVWSVVIRAAGWQDAVGIAGAIAILGVLLVAVADIVAGVAVALISARFFDLAARDAPRGPGYTVALMAVWGAAALAAGVAAVRLRAQAQRGIAEAVSLHRELVGLLVPSPRMRRLDVSVAAVCRPGEQRLELGGDFYGATERADGSIALLVGDVSGHGPAAAALAAMLRAAWEGLVEADVTPQVRLRTLDHLLLEHASYEEFFATVCSAVISGGADRSDDYARRPPATRSAPRRRDDRT